MQIKNFRIGILLVILVALVVLGSAFALSALPIKLAEKVLNWQGHDARNFEMVTHGFSNREIKIEYLKLKDEAKEIELENLFLHINDGKIVKLAADLLSFRDLTKPNQSLKTLLETWTTKETEPVCINEISLEEVHFALSYPAAPSILGVDGSNVCIGAEISFDNLAIDSADVTLTEKSLLWAISHNQFYDLSKHSVIEFTRVNSKISLTPVNKESLLRLIK